MKEREIDNRDAQHDRHGLRNFAQHTETDSKRVGFRNQINLAMSLWCLAIRGLDQCRGQDLRPRL